jgi:hypothetical protein
MGKIMIPSSLMSVAYPQISPANTPFFQDGFSRNRMQKLTPRTKKLRKTISEGLKNPAANILGEATKKTDASSARFTEANRRRTIRKIPRVPNMKTMKFKI